MHGSSPGRRLAAGALAPHALGALAFALSVVYLVGFEQGTIASLLTNAMADSGGVGHEFFHDARHLLGVPCH